MDDFDRALFEAFSAVWPRLSADPDELRARLGRRRAAEMGRPPRAWCMAVRASDRRIEPYRMAIVQHWSADGRGEIVREEVTLDAEVLRRLCAPVSVDRLPGESPSRLAERLGVGQGSVQGATRRGVFTVAKSFGLDGVRRGGRLLYTDRLLDPCSPVLRAADVIWGWTWRAAGERVPADFSQTIVREPEYRMWPGVRKFVGWRWICPGCKERVRTIYLPVRAMNLAEYFGARPEFDELDKVEDPPRVMGCTRCHRVRYFSRVDRHAWNALIAHCTGGLLYGREVRKPEFWRETRRRAYRPSLGRAPSKRREEVRGLLIKRMTIPQIGRELGISVNTVWNHVRVIYREMGVHSRREFLVESGKRTSASSVKSGSGESAMEMGEAGNCPSDLRGERCETARDCGTVRANSSVGSGGAGFERAGSP